MKKEIVVFANSVRSKEHCVAGKEIESKQWIRPVSPEGGEISTAKCTVSGGKDPVRPLQKIEIDVVGPYTSIKSQPDNWLIGKDRWEHIGEITRGEIGPYLDAPDTLWGTGDRVPYSEIEDGNMTIEQSLYLVKVSDLRLYPRTLYSGKIQIRASFSYKRDRYDLSLTDPCFKEHPNWPHYQEEGVLCVSLAGEKFESPKDTNYYYFKIAAALI